MATKAASTAIAKKTTGTALTTYKDRLAAQAAQVLAQEANTGGGNFITLPAGVLTWKGSEIPGNTFECVILDSMHENNYYEKRFNPKKPENPTCFAFGRDESVMAPHAMSKSAQSETCATCQWNKWGSARDQDGKPTRGKACAQKRRLMLLPRDALGSAQNIAKSEVAYLRISVTSVKNWAQYAKSLLAQYKQPPIAFVTRISVQRDQETQFKILFEEVEPITDEATMGALLDKMDASADEFAKPYEQQEEQPEEPVRKTIAAKRR